MGLCLDLASRPETGDKNTNKPRASCEKNIAVLTLIFSFASAASAAPNMHAAKRREWHRNKLDAGSGSIAVFLMSGSISLEDGMCEEFLAKFGGDFLDPMGAAAINYDASAGCGPATETYEAKIFASTPAELEQVEKYIATHDGRDLVGHRVKINRVARVLYEVTISVLKVESESSRTLAAASFVKKFQDYADFTSFTAKLAARTRAASFADLTSFIAENADNATASRFKEALARANMVLAQGNYHLVVDNKETKPSATFHRFLRDCRIYPGGLCVE